MHSAAKTCAHALLAVLPAALALVYTGALEPAFSTPKNAILTSVVALLTALALVSRMRWQPARDERAFCWLAAALAASTLLSAATAANRWITAASVTHTLCGPLLAASMLQILYGKAPEENWRKIQRSIVLAGIVVALVTVAEFFLPPASGRMRLHSTLGNPDFVATWLAATLPTALALAARASRGRSIWLAAALLITLAALLTGSRGAVLAMAAGLAVMALCWLPRWRGRLAALAIVATLGLLACATALNPRTTQESLRGRLLIWQVTLSNGAAASPLGSGPGSFAHDYPVQLGHYFTPPGRASLLRFARLERHAENDYVELWHDTGWLGLAVFLVMLAAWLHLAWRKQQAASNQDRALTIAAMATVAALLAAALVDFPFHRAETWALLWLMLAAPLTQPAPSATMPATRNWLRLAAALLIVAAGAAFTLVPLAASYQLAKGNTEEDANHLEAARDAYSAALCWDHTSADANFNLTRVLAEMENYPAALEQAKHAAIYVDEPELYLLRARILANVGRPSEARQQTRQALARFPYADVLRQELRNSAPADDQPARH
jgi:O-antigen ligase